MALYNVTSAQGLSEINTKLDDKMHKRQFAKVELLDSISIQNTN